MAVSPSWLPPALKYANYKGDWTQFLRVIYSIFEQDFKKTNIQYEGVKLSFDARIENGKEMVFWHLIQRDNDKLDDRLPDFRRCERIPWPKPIIEHPHESSVSVWENTRKKQIRILMWLEALDYLVVLGKRPKEIILITAYCTDIESQRRKIIKERDAFLNAKAAP
ncbi:hypothetical protein ACFLUS_05600 [Chloroflexota bacterium]